MGQISGTVSERMALVAEIASNNLNTAEEMDSAHQTVVENLQSISALVEESTAATEEMSASAVEIATYTHSVDQQSREIYEESRTLIESVGSMQRLVSHFQVSESVTETELEGTENEIS